MANDVYKKINREKLESLIKNEKASKERLKEEFNVQQELDQKQREAESIKKEEERARNKAVCDALKSDYKQSVEALSARLDYKAYKYSNPERNIIRDQYRAEKSILSDEYKGKKKNNNCW